MEEHPQSNEFIKCVRPKDFKELLFGVGVAVGLVYGIASGNAQLVWEIITALATAAGVTTIADKVLEINKIDKHKNKDLS